jgi:hypothetical protein
MQERRDLYLLWARYPQASRAGPLPYSIGPAGGQRPVRRRKGRLLTWLRRLKSRPAGAPAARERAGRREELDIHGYLELEFAVRDEQSRAGNRGR